MARKVLYNSIRRPTTEAVGVTIVTLAYLKQGDVENAVMLGFITKERGAKTVKAYQHNNVDVDPDDLDLSLEASTVAQQLNGLMEGV